MLRKALKKIVCGYLIHTHTHTQKEFELHIIISLKYYFPVSEQGITKKDC